MLDYNTAMEVVPDVNMFEFYNTNEHNDEVSEYPAEVKNFFSTTKHCLSFKRCLFSFWII